MLVLSLYKEDYDFYDFMISGKVGIPLTGNHTSWVAIVTPTDRRMSFCNRCVIEVLVAFLCCHFAFLFFC